MVKTKKLLLIFLFTLLAFTMNVYAEDKNEVTLNFEGGIIHDGYVEYSKIGKLQLFKGDELVTNISNDMKVDLNESAYEFVIEEIEDTGSVVGTIPIKLSINNWYYPMTTIVGETKSTFKLESSKFSGTLDVKLVRIGTTINTKVENVYNDITSTGIINLDNNNSFVIDFSKNDDLTNALKLFANLEKTLYYKDANGSLVETDNETEAIIKIVGNKQANKAILTVINTGDKKQFKGLQTKYTGSKLQYDGTDNGVINETRTDYYTRCTYNFTFKYNEQKEYNFIEGINQIYVISKNDIMKFRINADYSLFENGGKVYIDDVLVDSSNYTSESGSTIINFKKSFVDKLSKGEHTLKVVFNDNGVAITRFVINGDASLIENPNTGDNITSYIIKSIASGLGLVAIGSYVIKNKIIKI